MVRPRKRAVAAGGRLLLRFEPGMHAALRRAAAELGISLNEYCVRKLALPVSSLAQTRPAQLLVERVTGQLGADLAGLVVFGSWARGDAGTTSDLDVLIVVDPRRRLIRALYREWDRESSDWDGHTVEPHFVHPPEPGSIGTIWAEAAIDGIVLFERGLEVSRQLAAIRREIAAGRLVRRFIHGQPYWAEVA